MRGFAKPRAKAQNISLKSNMNQKSGIRGSSLQGNGMNLQGNRPNSLNLQGSFKKGGKVKKTGAYKLHKGEKVITAKAVKAKKCPTCGK